MDLTLPRRPRESHKGDYGKVAILAGKVGYTGAPVLAAGGALRTGAGLVFLGVPAPIYPIVAGKCLCAMPTPLPADAAGALSPDALSPALRLLEGKDAALLGPGLGSDPGTAGLIRALAGPFPRPLVLDADGINAFAGHIDDLDRREPPTVLTPHAGEFARLLGAPLPEDPAGAAARFAREHRCVLVLKGHRTVVAGPEGEHYVNQTGNPGMATGGSGDVLAGMVLSLLGQGFSPFTAACTAVYLHGLAGDLAAAELGEYAMTAADLLEYLPQAVKTIEE